MQFQRAENLGDPAAVQLRCFVPTAESVRSTPLHAARAILLCRAGKHHEALRVMVEEVRDPQAAEAFCCLAAQGRDADLRPTLLLSLLQIYLGSEEHLGAAADLINNNPQVLAAEQVVRQLPGSWAVQLVSQFLVGSLREMLHRRRMASLRTALSLAELTRHKVIWVSSLFFFFLLFVLPPFPPVNIARVLLYLELTRPRALVSKDAGLRNKVQTGRGAEVQRLSRRPRPATGCPQPSR